jgi:hypothetical protein
MDLKMLTFVMITQTAKSRPKEQWVKEFTIVNSSDKIE